MRLTAGDDLPEACSQHPIHHRPHRAIADLVRPRPHGGGWYPTQQNVSVPGVR